MPEKYEVPKYEITPGCVKEEEYKPSTEYKKEEYKPKEEEYKPSTEYKKELNINPKKKNMNLLQNHTKEQPFPWRKLHILFCSLFLPPAQQQHQKEKGEEPFFAKGTPSS